MTRIERKVERFRLGAAEMTPEERHMIRIALERAERLRNHAEQVLMVSTISDICAARGRAVQRKKSDARTDPARRVLVGARLPLEEAARVQQCASMEGKSLYRYTRQALEKACAETEQTFVHQGKRLK
jgi:hypothetical protein